MASLSLLGIVIICTLLKVRNLRTIVTIEISIHTGFMVSVIHRGVTGMSRVRAYWCFQFLGFMDKATTFHYVLDVAL